MQQNKTVKRLSMLVAIGLAVVLLALALRNIQWAEVGQTLQNARPELLVVVFAMNSLAAVVRAIRWGVLLSAEKSIGVVTLFWATQVGYLGNTLLPYRAGELIRSALLGRKTGVPGSTVLATALAERIFDVLALVLIVLIVAPGMGQLPDWLPPALNLMALFGLVAVLGLLFAPRFEGIILKGVARLTFLPEKWRQKLAGLLSQFIQGTRAFVHPGRAAGFAALTIVVWVVDGLGSVVMAQALNLQLTLPQALLLLAGLGLASAAPSTPGYVGIYQFVAVTVLPLFGFSQSQALTLILAGQGINVLAVILWGMIGYWRLNIKETL
jgi:uncharacterized protein (TIRG00374 family)